MTIGELIRELQKFPPELYITINDYDYWGDCHCSYSEALEFIEKIE